MASTDMSSKAATNHCSFQDSFHLARVCDYIHLNPVRARVVCGESGLGLLRSSRKRFRLGNSTGPNFQNDFWKLLMEAAPMK